MKQYIFGYGSIINKDSVNKTTIEKERIIKTITGYRREWNINIKSHFQTALGIVKNKDSTCNGVLVEVDDITAVDKREIGYTREKVDENIWIYVPELTGSATKEYPIMQSYIDVILEGCFKISKEFAKEFIDTTGGWNEHIIYDREDPKYPRAQKELKYKLEIDNLLSNHPKTKDFFKKKFI